MVRVGRRAYDLMYRIRAPWEGADRVELRALVRDGRCAPETLRRPGQPAARAIDLGCGAGTVAVELALAGFDVTGVDFSPVALRKAAAAAARAGLGDDRVRFRRGDLTAGGIPGVEGPFDLLVDYGTFDDLGAADRELMAAYVTGLARPGSRLFLFAFVTDHLDLPRFAFDGPSRAYPGLEAAEIDRRFGGAWRVEAIHRPGPGEFVGTWLLERKETHA